MASPPGGANWRPRMLSPRLGQGRSVARSTLLPAVPPLLPAVVPPALPRAGRGHRSLSYAWLYREAALAEEVCDMGQESPLIHKLMARQDLSRAETADLVSTQLREDEAGWRMLAFSVAAQTKGETLDELLGILDGMLRMTGPYRVRFPEELMDISSSGGTGIRKINVSTLSALVVGEPELAIAKQSFYGISSVTGSADVLRAVGIDGPDEISICGPSRLCGFRGDERLDITLTPEQAGLATAPAAAVAPRDAASNVRDFLRIAHGLEQGPKRDLVALNSGVALYLT